MMKMFKDDFNIYHEQPEVAYLDHAATSQTPDVVVNEMENYYHSFRANVHRGVYRWSAEASDRYETARSYIAQFINASPDELVFTSGATASINLVASSYFRKRLRKDQVILVSALEHHANLVPWQQVAKEAGCHIKVIPYLDDYNIDWDQLNSLLSEDIALVAITHSSNVLFKILCSFTR